jgi:hypothetical protein
MIREVNLTTARNLSPLFDEAIRKARPVLIVRGRRERGLLLERNLMLRPLQPYQFQINILPEDNGGFTLWLSPLNVGGHGGTLREARQDLLSKVRSNVTEFFQQYVQVLSDRTTSGTMVSMGVDWTKYRAACGR